jgi:hypothetical protein
MRLRHCAWRVGRYTARMRFAYRHAAAAVLGLFGSVACGSESAPEPELGIAREAIQGGATTTKYPFAVGINIGGQGTCSGALIAPNLVLTARHCVSTLNTGELIQPTSQFNQNYTASSFGITTQAIMPQGSSGYRGAREVLYPASNRAVGNDIALIILSSNVPASEATPVTPGVQHAMYNTKRNSSLFTAIGYGITGVGLNDSGTRRFRADMLVQCVNGSRTYCSPVTDTTGSSGIAPEEFVASAGVCSGDSGSSAYEQPSLNAGAPVSLGVLSRGPGTSCDQAVYSRTDSHKDFIIKGGLRAATLGGYPAPAWTVPAAQDPEDKPYIPNSGKLGEACQLNDDCASKFCVQNSAGSTVARICTQACVADPDNCPTGYVCNAKLKCVSGVKPGDPPPEPPVEEMPPAAEPAPTAAAPQESSGCTTSPVGTGSRSAWFGFAAGACALLAARARSRKRAS